MTARNMTRQEKIERFINNLSRLNWDGEETPDGKEHDISGDDYHETMIWVIETARELVESKP